MAYLESRKIQLTSSGCFESKIYKNNTVITSNYTIYNFIFFNLYQQFHRVPNIFFLTLIVFQVLPYVSSVEYISTITPLIFILSVTAIKDGYDDYKKHKHDRIANERMAFVLNRNKEIFEMTKWKDIRVGDIVLIKENDVIPADILLLSSSNEDGYCFVNTQHLDGELNLTYKICHQEFNYLSDNCKLLNGFENIFEFENPSQDLHSFECRIINNSNVVTNIDNLLLRGSSLKNTDWCVGVVIYAGHDTKVMQNTGKASYKRTGIEKSLNSIAIKIIFGLLIFVLFSSFCAALWTKLYGLSFEKYLPMPYFLSKFHDNIKIALIYLIDIFSYAILYSNCVPISLYVSIELVKLSQSMLINCDQKMVSENGQKVECRTTALAEDLGQIDHVLTDKTGTLTINIFKFQSCAIGRNIFLENDSINKDLYSLISAKSEKEIVFFKVLALCHTVLIKNNVEYRAQSPDEECLVMYAKKYGVILKERTTDSMKIEINGKLETYQIHCILEFSNARKRMSIIVENNGTIYLFSKGADNVIIPTCNFSPGEMEVAEENLKSLSSQGLRILCLSYKKLSKKEFHSWYKKFQSSNKILDGKRSERLEKVYLEMEKDMTFLGVTGIEDKLQEGVRETLKKFSSIEIKVWMLTGDKMETAINIGYSCGLFNDSFTEIFTISENVKESIDNCLIKIKNNLEQNGYNYEDYKKMLLENQPNKNNNLNPFGLIITGEIASICLEKYPQDFYELSIFCRNMICCRMIPLLKSDMVHFVKKYYPKITTLAIGDGANDISMIKAANIGIGIFGREGNQAALHSDFSIPQFKDLQRLIFVHGRWCYVRITKFMYYFFFKNIAFATLNFWFIFFSAYSAQKVFTNDFIIFYNLFFTALPVMILGIFDQDASDEESLNNPKIYKDSLRRRYFNNSTFFQCIFDSFATSFIIFFVTLFATWGQVSVDGHSLNNIEIFYQFIMAYHITVVTMKISFMFSQWTAIHVLVILISIGSYFMIILIFSFGSAIVVYSSPIFWISAIPILLLIFIPYLTQRFNK